MPSEKRQRQDEGRLQRLEAQRAEARKGQRKRQARNIGIILGVILLVAAGFAIFSADDADDGDDEVSTDSTPSTECPQADGSSERTISFEEPPPMCIDEAKAYTATLETTEGDIVIELDAANAPITVNNFVVLSRYHFYDGSPFHRIVPGFVNQAGQPEGAEPGVDGPGYAIADELPADPATAYSPGTVAMANSGPESGGSQFFLVIGDANGALSGAGSYSVFGKIVEGQDVSEAINALGGEDEKPTKPVAITSVTIAES
jgi:cyclophilin family peptidyl-prolyl cis-trans isomerase